MSPELQLEKLALKYVFDGTKHKQNPNKLSAFRQNLKIKMVRAFGHKQTKEALRKAFEIAEMVGL